MNAALRSIFATALIALSGGGSLRAELLVRDLGEGLAYLRAQTLPADLPPAPPKAQPTVLDLRFSTASEPAATALGTWLDFRASAKTPVFILVNADTPRSLRLAVAALLSHPGIVTIGSGSAEFVPDFAITAPHGAERKAYDALAHGAPLESLLVENADKPRNDEATIMRDRANPPNDADSAFNDDPLDAAKPTPPPPPPLVIDLALQKAVQLHRALLALKRL